MFLNTRPGEIILSTSALVSAVGQEFDPAATVSAEEVTKQLQTSLEAVDPAFSLSLSEGGAFDIPGLETNKVAQMFWQLFPSALSERSKYYGPLSMETEEERESRILLAQMDQMREENEKLMSALNQMQQKASEAEKKADKLKKWLHDSKNFHIKSEVLFPPPLSFSFLLLFPPLSLWLLSFAKC